MRNKKEVQNSRSPRSKKNILFLIGFQQKQTIKNFKIRKCEYLFLNQNISENCSAMLRNMSNWKHSGQRRISKIEKDFGENDVDVQLLYKYHPLKTILMYDYCTYPVKTMSQARERDVWETSARPILSKEKLSRKSKVGDDDLFQYMKNAMMRRMTMKIMTMTTMKTMTINCQGSTRAPSSPALAAWRTPVSAPTSTPMILLSGEHRI